MKKQKQYKICVYIVSSNYGKFLKKFEKSKIQFNINQKLNGKRVGNNFDLSFESLATNKFNYKLNFNSIQSHPGLIYDIYQSDYDNISFYVHISAYRSNLRQ